MTDTEKISVIADQVADLIGISNQILARLEKLEGTPAKSKPFSDEPVPQPERVIDSAANVEIHFGKNQGTPLGRLSDNQLSFYAAKWTLREKRNGGCWDNDLLLLDAARTLWHEKKGTLKFSTGPKAESQEQKAPAPQENLDEEVPF